MKAFKEMVTYHPQSRIFASQRQDVKFDFEWHYHDAFEITLITKGRGQRFVGDTIESYETGDLVLISPGLAHTWQSEEGCMVNEAFVLQFSRDSLGEGAFETEDFRPIRELLGYSGGYTFKYDVTIKKLFSEICDSSGVRRVIYFLELLQTLLNLKKKQICTQDSIYSLDEETNEKMNRIMVYLMDLNGDAPDIPDLAQHLGMSESTFRRFIKRNTGKSLISFHNELCISKACKMLVESEETISYISTQAGYRNLSHFNRVFKNSKKMTPREFRKSFKSPK